MKNRKATNRSQFKCRSIGRTQEYHASLSSLIFAFVMLLMIVSLAPNFLNIEDTRTTHDIVAMVEK